MPWSVRSWMLLLTRMRIMKEYCFILHMYVRSYRREVTNEWHLWNLFFIYSSAELTVSHSKINLKSCTVTFFIASGSANQNIERSDNSTNLWTSVRILKTPHITVSLEVRDSCTIFPTDYANRHLTMGIARDVYPPRIGNSAGAFERQGQSRTRLLQQKTSANRSKPIVDRGGCSSWGRACCFNIRQSQTRRKIPLGQEAARK